LFIKNSDRFLSISPIHLSHPAIYEIRTTTD